MNLSSPHLIVAVLALQDHARPNTVLVDSSAIFSALARNFPLFDTSLRTSRTRKRLLLQKAPDVTLGVPAKYDSSHRGRLFTTWLSLRVWGRL